MNISKLSVQNPILVNMLMIIVFIVGTITMINIPKEEMPPVDFGMFIVNVVYPGVSPQEMETLITNKIEDEISDVDGIDFIASTSSEGRVTIRVRFEPDVDIDQAWEDFNMEMDKVNDLPDEAEDPMIMKLDMREISEISNIAISGNYTENGIREIAEDMRDDLLDLKNISKVDIFGTRERQIWIEIDNDKLADYGFALNEIRSIISNRNNNFPAGTVNFNNAEFIVRTEGEFNSVNEIKQLILRMDNNGRTIKLKDVAKVSDTLEDSEIISKLNSEKSVTLQVYMKGEGNIITVMEDVRDYAKKMNQSIPELKVQVRNDGSVDVKNSLSALSQSAILGIILVFISLMIFIGWRNAALAAIGIPFSFLLTFFLMDQLGITMNNLSLFGLILVLGMIVDDAIVVLENVHRHIEEGMKVAQAAIKGTTEIMYPVITAVLTTAVAFLPILMMRGMMGKFFAVFPIVVSIALFASLFECLVILPSHIADFQKNKKISSGKQHAIMAPIKKVYLKILKGALKHRYLATFLTILAFLASIAAVMSGLVKFEFFPKGTPKTIVLKLVTPTGTKLEKTNEVVTKVEKHILSMKEATDIEAIVSTVGQQVNNHRWEIKSSYAELKIDFKDIENMTYSVDEIKNAIRKYISNMSDLYSYRFDVQRGGPPTGGDVNLRIIGEDFDELKDIANYIEGLLANIPGVADIEDTFTEGKEEVKIVPNFERLAFHGVDISTVGYALRTASYGTTISKFRGAGIDEYDIILKYATEDIDDIEEVKDFKIRSKYGTMIKLSEVADFEISKGFSEIEHRDGKRIIEVTASTTDYEKDGELVTRYPSEVNEMLMGNKLRGTQGLLSNFAEQFPGNKLEFGGVQERRKESFDSLKVAFVVALLLIFAILATLFKSVFQPLIVMVAIPFAVIGVVFGLFALNIPFSLNSGIAFLALAGVVVNDSLILVEFVNKERSRGVDRWNSLIHAGLKRIRPIILTTATTIFGVMPMILDSSESSVYWKPMAVSIAFGLAFATFLTLVMIPVFYSLVDSFFGKLGLTRFEQHISFDEAMKNCCDKDLLG